MGVCNTMRFSRTSLGNKLKLKKQLKLPLHHSGDQPATYIVLRNLAAICSVSAPNLHKMMGIPASGERKRERELLYMSIPLIQHHDMISCSFVADVFQMTWIALIRGL